MRQETIIYEYYSYHKYILRKYGVQNQRSIQRGCWEVKDLNAQQNQMFMSEYVLELICIEDSPKNENNNKFHQRKS